MSFDPCDSAHVIYNVFDKSASKRFYVREQFKSSCSLPPPLPGSIEVELVDVNITAFEILLRHLLGLPYPIGQRDFCEVARVAEKFSSQTLLKEACDDYKKSLTAENTCETLMSLRESNAPSPIIDATFEFISHQARQIAKNGNTNLLHRDDLLRLCADDTLDIPEIDVFELVLQWGKAHSQGGSLAESLQDFIPLIRYGTISAHHLRTIVRPTQLVRP